MKNTLAAAACAAALATLSTISSADDRGPFPRNATFTTLVTTPLAIEGLTADSAGNLYTTGRAAPGTPEAPTFCPVWRFTGNVRAIVGFIANPAPGCNPSGITFDPHGDLYIADANSGGNIWKLTPNSITPPTVTLPFASGVPGTNGVAFDRDGNLWTGDGTTGNGRVWRIDPAGGVSEVFRIQPMRNGTALGGDIAGDGVGRQARTFPPGTSTVTVQPSPTPTVVTPAGGQDLVANGLAFTPEGDLYVADTARGAIWKVEFDRRGAVQSRMNCDTTFTANTLCLENILVAHPYLEGTDGIALDRAGNIWNSANERNAIVVVTKDREVVEIFRNPVNPTTGLRNSAADNRTILEFPTSPVLVGGKFCTSNSDGDRRDNSPRAAGEINGGAGNARGKISCMDQELEIPGLPLPVR